MTKVEQLIENILVVSIPTRAELEELVAAAHEEGAIAERERILAAATPIDDSLHQMSLVVPYSVPAPKEAS
jgi:hypothetical protein